MDVLIPMGIGRAACRLLAAKAMGFAYKTHYATVSHGVLGIVAATAVMLLPYQVESLRSGITYALFISGGAAVSFGLSCVCNKLKAKSHQK